MEGGVLVPHRHEPVGGKRGRQCSAYDEAKVARACGCDEAWFGACGERVDHRGGVLAMFGQRPAKDAANGCGIGACGYGSFVERVEKRLRVLCGRSEARSAVRHKPNLQAEPAFDGGAAMYSTTYIVSALLVFSDDGARRSMYSTMPLVS
jgi:hypothetical protein